MTDQKGGPQSLVEYSAMAGERSENLFWRMNGWTDGRKRNSVPKGETRSVMTFDFSLFEQMPSSPKS
jgi:hypothetical protein